MSEGIDCPCGFIPGDCNATDPILKNPNQANTEVCAEAGFDSCFVSADFGATCLCRCGFSGEFCEEKEEILSYNYALAFIVPCVVILGLLFWIKKIQLQNKGIFNVSPKIFVESEYSFANPKVHLAYRIVMLALGWGVMINALFFFEGLYILRAFTIWNWWYFILIFTLGVRYSIKSLNGTLETEKQLSTLDRFYYISLEIEFPTTIFIAVVVWLILLPDSYRTGGEGILLNFNSYIFHGANVAFLWIEIMVTKVRMIKSHVAYCVLWDAVYVLFHSFYMIVRDARNLNHCPQYGFLSLASPDYSVWAVGLCSALAVFYFVGYFLTFWKPDSVEHFDLKEDAGSLEKSASKIKIEKAEVQLDATAKVDETSV